jgi:predicted dehydrogenase
MVPAVQALRAFWAERPPCRAVSIRLRTQFIPWPERADDGPATGAAPRMGESGDFGGASHVVDLALHLAGAAPEAVQAVLRGFPAHQLTLLMETKGGCVVTLEHQPTAEPGIHLDLSLSGAGFEARLEAGYRPEENGWRFGVPSVFAEGARRELAVAPPGPPALEPWAQAHVETARAFLAAIEGARPSALARIADGAIVQAVFDAAMASSLKGARVGVAPF